MEKYILGIDFGTDSVRTVIINAENGCEEASDVAVYRRWAGGVYCNPSKNQFRQHPLDHIEALVESVRTALSRLAPDAGSSVAAVGIDTTGSTPCVVDRNGTPLSLNEEFRDNPNAMFILWKDHTAVVEAEEINHAAKSWGGTDFTQFEGGIYSSEWFWAKILHVLRNDRQIQKAAFSWVEHCDWIPALLTGRTDPVTLVRSRCAAGHKAMWHADWGGLPDEEFLAGIDPLLRGCKERLYKDTYTSDTNTGGLTSEWADRLGLRPGTAVAVGAFDAHMGAVGGGIKQGALTKIMGTSTCDMLVAPVEVIGEKQVAGICGQVDGSIIPGMIGLEAGQSGFGDVYAWFAGLLSWPLDAVQTPDGNNDIPSNREFPRKAPEEIRENILTTLESEAAKISVSETGLIALDWLNGRRTPDADQTLKGAVIGLTLGTTAPKIYKALIESTAFGSKAIVDRFISEGIAINEVIALGGIPQKSPLVMQITSDILNMPIKVAASEQTCALGAAMFGAVAAGIYRNIEEAQESMGSGFNRTYTPNSENAAVYGGLYRKYSLLGNTLEPQLRDLAPGT